MRVTDLKSTAAASRCTRDNCHGFTADPLDTCSTACHDAEVRPELQDIVDDVSRLLERAVTLEDRHFNMVSFGSHGEAIDDIRQDSILRRRSPEDVRAWFEQFGITTSDGPVRTPASPDNKILPRLCLPARWNGVTYGYLWLIDEHHDVDESRFPAAMALAGRAGALMAQQSRARDDLEFKLRDLLSSDRETAEGSAQDVDQLGIIRRGVPVVAVELRLTKAATGQQVPINLWSLPRSVLTATSEDHTTLLVGVPGRDLDIARDMAARARELYAERLDPALREHLVVGVGAPRADLVEARASWQEARLAARVCEAVPTLGPVAVWPELGVYRLLACGPETALAGAVLDAAVLRLLDHGDRELVDTATTYLGHGGNVQQTAASLSVHRQTVYYRLQRIELVTGLDLSRGDQRLLLQLGLTLAPLLRRPSPSPPR
jgi:sugar diacid utilization regulator